jgi:hypothetical protein
MIRLYFFVLLYNVLPSVHTNVSEEHWYLHRPLSLGGTTTQTTKCKIVSETTILLQLDFAVFYIIFEHKGNLNIIIALRELDRLLHHNSINIFHQALVTAW